MTPTLRLSVKDEKSGRECVLVIDHNVPLAVVHRTLARSGVFIDKHKLKVLIEQAKAATDGSVH